MLQAQLRAGFGHVIRLVRIAGPRLDGKRLRRKARHHHDDRQEQARWLREVHLPDLEASGWQAYFNDSPVSYAPHYQAYLWACYLWAHRQTGCKLFLERAENAVRMTMEAYPERWHWTNGIAQERARMLLPLAWLVSATSLGRAMRAVAENPTAARVVGVNVGRVTAGTYALSSALGAVAGVLLALNIGQTTRDLEPGEKRVGGPSREPGRPTHCAATGLTFCNLTVN